MAPTPLTVNGVQQIDFPSVLYYVCQNSAINYGTASITAPTMMIPSSVQGSSSTTSSSASYAPTTTIPSSASGSVLLRTISFHAPDASMIPLHGLSDPDFCSSIKNSIDPARIRAPGEHSQAHLLVLHSSRKFAIERAKEVPNMKVFTINPQELVFLGTGPALYRLDDLVDQFYQTHLREFGNHWEGQYYVDEVGCFLAFSRILGRVDDQTPLNLPLIRKIPEAQYAHIPRNGNFFLQGLKPFGQFYCSKARHYAAADHFPTNPTTTNGRSASCYRHQNTSWKAQNPTWPRDAGLPNPMRYGHQ